MQNTQFAWAADLLRSVSPPAPPMLQVAGLQDVRAAASRALPPAWANLIYRLHRPDLLAAVSEVVRLLESVPHDDIVEGAEHAKAVTTLVDSSKRLVCHGHQLARIIL